MDALSKTEPTNEQIVAWVEEHYGQKFAEAIRNGLLHPVSPGFADAVRRALIREMTTR